MKKPVTFASNMSITALVCSSVAVLLTACGGGTSGTGNAEQARTAAYSHDSAVAQSGASAAVAPAIESADATTPVGADASAENYTGNFELAGYAVDPLSAEAEVDATAGTELAPAPAAAQTVAGDGSTRLLAMAVAVTTSTPATTYNYYVAPNGSDTAAGTKAAPFKTLARAAKAATKASTTVWVAPGTYAGGIRTNASGSASGRIYYVSTTKWGAKIVPPTSSSNSSAWDNRGSYVSIIGFDIDGSKSGSGTKWLSGIYNGGSYDVIQGNHVHHIAKTVPCTSGGGSAIGVDSYYHGVKADVIGNTVHDIGPAGCTFVQGIYVSTSGSVKNNVVYRVAAAAIHLWHDATNVIITNNTVSSSEFGIIVGGGDFYFTSAGADNTAVYNNIVYDNKYGVSEQGRTGKNNTYRNNLVYKNTYNWTLKNGLTHTATVSSDPLLAGYSRTAATPNFHLSSSSPAIGRGIAVNALPTDIDGKPRNAATGYDIGAYQH